MTKYFLADHAYLCVTEAGAIILDLKKDRYVGLGQRETASLGAFVEGWPCNAATGAAETQQVAATLASQMVAQGLLTPHSVRGKNLLQVSLQKPVSTAVDAPSDALSKLDFVRFARACLSAAAWRRLRSLEHIAARIARRKRKRRAEWSTVKAADMACLTARFIGMRPFLFGSKDECLFDSISLLEFLSSYDAYPTWVIGVRTGPFAAHSWVQHEDMVLNDTVENVSAYMPILTI